MSDSVLIPQGSVVAPACASSGSTWAVRRGGNGPSARLLFERAVRRFGKTCAGTPPTTWLLLDLALLSGGVALAYHALPLFGAAETPHIALWQATAVFAFSVIIASLVFGLYERETLAGRSTAVARLLMTTLGAAAIAYAIIYVVMYSTVSRRAAAMTLAIFFGGGCVFRLAAVEALRRVQRGLLVVGPRSLFESFQEAQRQGFLREYRLAGYAGARPEASPQRNDGDYLGTIAGRIDELAAMDVTDVVVGAQACADEQVMRWMVPCLQAGCRVTNEATFYEKAAGQILVDRITPDWFLFSDLKVHCEKLASIKRVFDLVTAGAGLALCAPLWPLIALAIKLGDGGPVFYSQDRVGQNGSVFRLYKFRTMRINAETNGSVWASPNDPRVTRVGRLLRKSRLDELPQLYNILVGDMSLVGPRPERPDIVERLVAQVPFYAERHLVKPGLTGWAQISYRYGSSVEDARRKLQFDLYYLKHMSFEMDVVILFRTVGTFLRGGC